jgi:undecaprenyl pyrophosphate phosphatase UppP
LTLWKAARTGLFGRIDGWGYVVGVLVAFTVGLIAIRALLTLVARGRLWIFGVYCLAVGVAVFVLR